MTAELPAGRVSPADWIPGRYVLYAGILAHVGAGLGHLLRHGHGGNLGQTAFEAAILLGLPAAMVSVVAWRRSDVTRDEDYWRMAVGGGLGMATALSLLGLHLIDTGISSGVSMEWSSLASSLFTLLLAANGGAFAGLLVGAQQIRVRKVTREAERAETRAELSERHRQSLLFLNRILRHHVLNGLNVILLEVDRLRSGDTGDRDHSLDLVERRGNRMADYVEDIRSVVDALSGEVTETTIDLSAVLEAELETASYSFPSAEFEASIPPGITVAGTHLTGVVFENLLENAVRHNDADVPRVRVAVEETESTVRVTVADNGPGMPDDRKTAYFRRGAHGKDSLGEGLGLYLADTVVSRSGGDIWIEDNDPAGTRVVVELRASPSTGGAATTADETVRHPTIPEASGGDD
jgi:signal transduction histidine kinase